MAAIESKWQTGQQKREATDAAARSITDAEAGARTAKTARLKEARLKMSERLVVERKLDEALDDSFPASHPVEIGHSDHVARPKKSK